MKNENQKESDGKKNWNDKSEWASNYYWVEVNSVLSAIGIRYLLLGTLNESVHENP